MLHFPYVLDGGFAAGAIYLARVARASPRIVLQGYTTDGLYLLEWINIKIHKHNSIIAQILFQCG